MERDYRCSDCGKTFRNESGLSWHLHHIHLVQHSDLTGESKNPSVWHGTETALADLIPKVAALEERVVTILSAVSALDSRIQAQEVTLDKLERRGANGGVEIRSTHAAIAQRQEELNSFATEIATLVAHLDVTERMRGMPRFMAVGQAYSKAAVDQARSVIRDHLQHIPKEFDPLAKAIVGTIDI